jgi:hypothetical protein
MSAGQAVDARLDHPDDGDRPSLAAYARQVAAARTACLRGHRLLHAQETRRPHHPFWTRRLTALPELAHPTPLRGNLAFPCSGRTSGVTADAGNPSALHPPWPHR